VPYPTILDPALDELRQAYRDRALVLFVGAGVSAAAGLPSWAKLVKILAERAAARGATAEVLDEIDSLAKSWRFIDALLRCSREGTRLCSPKGTHLGAQLA
jgi:NAD-dependent SIR2 family protein deacetylase